MGGLNGKKYKQQSIWELSNDAELSSFTESLLKKSQPWGVPMEKTRFLSEQKEIGAHCQQNIWHFPKCLATMQQEIPTQVLSRNRFQILADAEFEEKYVIKPCVHLQEQKQRHQRKECKTMNCFID